MTHKRICRSCGAPLEHTLVDLGVMPLSNHYISPAKLDDMEPFYPDGRAHLHHLLAGPAAVAGAAGTPVRRLRLLLLLLRLLAGPQPPLRGGHDPALEPGPEQPVVELASNDGYLLQYFIAAGVPVLGVEPAANVAKVARPRACPRWSASSGKETARQLVQEGQQADLLPATTCWGTCRTSTTSSRA
jgi:hypothetical protein